MPATPKPGQAVRGSRTGRPVMAALDLLGRRWALRILWELREEPIGPRTLLARVDGLSPSVLYERLRELTEAKLVTKTEGRYALSAHGRSLMAALQPLDAWAKAWARRTLA